jgi:hypothetical protein
MMKKPRVLLPAAGVVLASVGGACAWLVYSADRAVAVTVPRVSGQVAAICADLARHLPATVAGQSRDRTSPSSDLVAAWGQSAIVLTCGAAVPAELDPSSKTYDPEAQAVYANGVAWLPVQVNDGYEFYTTQREVYVEVFVPSSYNLADGNPGLDAPVDVSPAIIAGTPTNAGKSGADVSPE